MTLPFYVYLFQFVMYPGFVELYDWIILTGWTAIWLLLATAAFLLQTPRTRKVWWHYLAGLLVVAVGIWGLVVTYNSYQRWLYLESLLPLHGVIVALRILRTPYQAAVQTCQWQFALVASVLVLVIVGAGWRLQQALSRKLDLAPGKYYGHLVISLLLAGIGLCGLALGIFLLTKLYQPLISAPQLDPFLFHEPTALELIGLFTVYLGGPLNLLLLALAAFVERHKLVNRFASSERRLPAMEARSAQRR